MRLAQQAEDTQFSRKALLNRWPSREEFLRDAIVFAMCYKDVPASEQVDASRLAGSSGSLAALVGSVAEEVHSALIQHPRSYLLSQIAPFLAQHPAAQQAVSDSANATREQWKISYQRLLELLGIEPRPDWTIDRISVALQCMIDGVVVRHQIDPELVDQAVWARASLLADTVIAFCVGVLDFHGNRRTTREHLDDLAARSAGRTKGGDHSVGDRP